MVFTGYYVIHSVSLEIDSFRALETRINVDNGYQSNNTVLRLHVRDRHHSDRSWIQWGMDGPVSTMIAA